MQYLPLSGIQNLSTIQVIYVNGVINNRTSRKEHFFNLPKVFQRFREPTIEYNLTDMNISGK